MPVDAEKLTAQLAGFPASPENGATFYKFFFATFPHNRKYFKGHEDTKPEDIPSDPYFQRLGWNVLAKVHDLVATSGDEAAFKQMVQEMVVSHKNKRGIEVGTWSELHAIFGGLLKSLGAEPDAEWAHFCRVFNDHAKEVADRGYVL